MAGSNIPDIASDPEKGILKVKLIPDQTSPSQNMPFGFTVFRIFFLFFFYTASGEVSIRLGR